MAPWRHCWTELIEIIIDIQAIYWLIHHLFLKFNIGLFQKPTITAKWILFRVFDQPMLDWVELNIVQSGEIGGFMRDARIPIVVLDFATGRLSNLFNSSAVLEWNCRISFPSVRGL